MDIALIPGGMRRCHYWARAPQLMERWFSLPANSHPESGPPDTITIRMDWALTFARCRQVFDQIVSNRAWRDEESQTRIGRWLASQNRLTSQPTTFGIRNFRTATPTVLENDFICTRPVGSLMDPLDDMYGALGCFDLRVVVRGTARPVPTSAGPRTMTRSTLRSPYTRSPSKRWASTCGTRTILMATRC
jgi:hypothetical protein